MITEKTQMFPRQNPDGSHGHIYLENVADPKTVRVFVDKEEIIPCSFDELGHPNFTTEQVRMDLCRKNQIEHSGGTWDYDFYTVTYEKRKFDVPKSFFDSTDAILYSLRDMKSFHEMLDNRTVYAAMSSNHKLKEYVLFGYIYLSSGGLVYTVENSPGRAKSPVETSYCFWNRYHGEYKTINVDNPVPPYGACCPVCGKEFTIKDLRTPLVWKNSIPPFYHKECYTKYRINWEVVKLSSHLMEYVYPHCNYDIIPNEYEKQSIVPWFMFHTPDGDIKVGWRYRVISIEWQENFKPFDFQKLFENEVVPMTEGTQTTKWQENGKCGIHAWSEEKAQEYLRRVRDEVGRTYQCKEDYEDKESEVIESWDVYSPDDISP